MLPVGELDVAIAIIEEKGRGIWPDFRLCRDLFLKWMGCWFKMLGDKKRRQEDYFTPSETTSLSEVMSWDTFRKIKRVLAFPTYDDSAPEKLADMGPGPDNMRFIRRWLHAYNDQWKTSWEAGTYLVVDETMVAWSGTGTAHLTYIPRKPSPLGIMVKVTCCGSSGVLLHAELVEGAVVDHNKEWYSEYKATTACTLRLTKQWHGTGRVVVGDAWFGSVRIVEELRNRGLYAVMCVKQGCSGYPRAELRASLRRRGDQRFYEKDIWLAQGPVPMWAGGHQDKQPLLLCATTGTSLPGEKKVRYRSRLENGNIVKVRYELEQPDMHATYRKYAPAVDQYNKLALQPGTLTDMWQTRNTWHRLWAATLSFVETNAQLAYQQGNTQGIQLTKGEWFCALAKVCINNPFAPAQPRVVGPAGGHTQLLRSKQGLCWICRKKTNWKCSCGRAFCGNSTRTRKTGLSTLGIQTARDTPRTCWVQHLSAVSAADPQHTGLAKGRRGPKPKA